MFSSSIESRLKTSCQKSQVAPKPSNASSTAGSPVGPSSSSRTRGMPVTWKVFWASQMMRLRPGTTAAAASASRPSRGPLRPSALALTERAWRIVVSALRVRSAHSRWCSLPRLATRLSTKGGTTQWSGLRQRCMAARLYQAGTATRRGHWAISSPPATSSAPLTAATVMLSS